MTVLAWVALAITGYLTPFLVLVLLARRRTVATRSNGPVDTDWPPGLIRYEAAPEPGRRSTLLGLIYLPLSIAWCLLVRPWSFSYGTGRPSSGGGPTDGSNPLR